MRNLMSFFVFFFSFLFSSCLSDGKEDTSVLCQFKQYGKVINEIKVSADGEEVTVSVFSGASWTIDNDADWVHLSSTSGENTVLGTFVKFNVEENPGEEVREAVLSLKAGDSVAQLKIYQKGKIITPEGWEDAFTTVKNMGVGWNLGNTLDTWLRNGPDGSDWRSWETGWGQCVTKPELMHMMKNAGFGAIRVPVTWGPHMDAEGKVYESWMNRVHEIVDYVLDAGMYCIINLHHDTGEDKDAWVVADMEVYNRNKERYASLWKQVAEEFKDYDHRLLFESFNEILDGRESWCFSTCGSQYDAAYAQKAYRALNAYAQTFTDAVRSTGGNNLCRNLVINTYAASSGSGNWSPYLREPLTSLSLPEDVTENHIIFQVHTYPDISDMNRVKSEVDDMFAGLEEHLVSKGAPVIVGEWGTSNVDNAPDYIYNREAMLEYADYFVRKAKQYDMATFYWMGLSNYVYRSVPAFNEPDLAETIVKAYHGQGHQGIYPTMDDFDVAYKVTYLQQWAELSISEGNLSMDNYSGIRVVLNSKPNTGELSVKMYGESDGKEQYNSVRDAEAVYTFDPSVLGSHCKGVTLQYMKTGTYTTVLKSVHLIRKDGTEEEMLPESYWGCSVELFVE
ncbi:MAG: cellulase family glycosylhydrolase [Bacteroidales bacterium]|nr:cellulase family glycosylhydrolase [Bacteroidales bacterium]